MNENMELLEESKYDSVVNTGKKVYVSPCPTIISSLHSVEDTSVSFQGEDHISEKIPFYLTVDLLLMKAHICTSTLIIKIQMLQLGFAMSFDESMPKSTDKQCICITNYMQ